MMCRRKKVWSIVTPPNFEFDCHKKKFVSVLFSYLRWLKFSGPRNLNSTTISSARYNKMVFALNKTGKGCYCDMKLCNARINQHILKEVFFLLYAQCLICIFFTSLISSVQSTPVVSVSLIMCMNTLTYSNEWNHLHRLRESFNVFLKFAF